jgi:endoglucanase
MTFEVKRGTNVSHWLSQSKRRGAERAAWFTQDDVRRIARLGFDHVRLPMDEVQMWDEAGRAEEGAFALLDAALDWCAQAGLRAIVDLHVMRSHFFNDKAVPPLFADPAEVGRLADLWRELSARLRLRPTDLVAYELLNEAVAPTAEDWNRVALAAFAAVRALEPERTIVLGSNRFNSADTFDELAVPDDDRCILTFHFYMPMLVTHHQAGWWDGGAYAGRIRYPGLPIAPRDYARQDETLRSRLAEWNRPYDRAAMLVDLRKPLAVRERTGLPLYCGEFGCYEKTPLPLRQAWYRDIVRTFKEQRIAWANWDYKGGFGVVTPDGRDTGIAGILLG